MHPQIRQIGPGTCPKCGMTLEPVMPGLEDEDNPELADFRRRFWWTLPLTVIVTAIAMSGGVFDPMLGAARPWVELALATPVVLWSGWPFFVRCARVDRQPQPEHVDADRAGESGRPICIASSQDRLRPRYSRPPSAWANTWQVYPEAAAVIYFADVAGPDAGAQGAITDLGRHPVRHLGLAPKTARRIAADGSEEDVPLAHVHVGDLLRVRPGREAAGRWDGHRRQQRGG